MQNDEPLNRWTKQKIFLRGYYHGMKMWSSLNAMELAMQHHIGQRKDGADEITHQFEIVHFLSNTLEKKVTLEKFDTIIASSFLHDLVEDYPELYSFEKMMIDFNEEITEIVRVLTKSRNFNKLSVSDQTDYFDKILKSPEAVIIKGADRIHNIQTSLYGFDKTKREQYINEVEAYFYPMLKKARHLYPEYYFVIVSISQLLEKQIFFLREIHAIPDASDKICFQSSIDNS